MPNKAQKELWKQANEANLPLRKLPRPRPFDHGRDKHGRDIGDYPLEEYDAWVAKSRRLFDLQSASDYFRERRGLSRRGGLANWLTGEVVDDCAISEEDVQAERARRKEMAELRDFLQGKKTASYALDPDWDNVVPMPQVEPEGALAAIAYPEDYAE